jgi:hypothetical protein
MYIRLISTATGSILSALRHEEALLTLGQSHLLGRCGVERAAPAPSDLCTQQSVSYTEAQAHPGFPGRPRCVATPPREQSTNRETKSC